MNKDPLAISLIVFFTLSSIFAGAAFMGLINHPGHCGATNPADIRFDEITIDGGSDL